MWGSSADVTRDSGVTIVPYIPSGIHSRQVLGMSSSPKSRSPDSAGTHSQALSPVSPSEAQPEVFLETPKPGRISKLERTRSDEDDDDEKLFVV